MKRSGLKAELNFESIHVSGHSYSTSPILISFGHFPFTHLYSLCRVLHSSGVLLPFWICWVTATGWGT